MFRAISKTEKEKKSMDVLIVEPEKYVERFVKAGAEILTVHLETLKNPFDTLRSIRELGVKVGITINPDVEVRNLYGLVSQVDMVLLMSVFAGYGGQKFIEETYPRIDELKDIIADENPDCLIQIDGGVNLENAPKLFNAGVNVLVAGSSVFKAPDPVSYIHQLLHQ